MKVEVVALNQVSKIFAQVEDLIKPVVDASPLDMTLAGLKRDLLRGHCKMIIVSFDDLITGVNVVQVVQTMANKRIMYIPITSGTQMPECIDDFFDLVHKLAREADCSEIRGFIVRPGWHRMLKKHGWYLVHEIVGCKVKAAKHP